MLSFLTGAPLDNYICAECGFVESYLSDPAGWRDFIRRKLRRAQQ
ncbi:MAG TPA: hypothetical protein VG796_03265 [Verrucomicrobiales bacterium]|jgi:hypothetical protein|nr:hypothetical protein [Verrucomicrobiales bacterium]